MKSVLAIIALIMAASVLITGCQQTAAPTQFAEQHANDEPYIHPTSIPDSENVSPEQTPSFITIQGVQHCTTLTWLQLSSAGLSDEDILPLRYMTNLENLFIDNNNISDIIPLSELTNLKSLAISSNSIHDITPLSGLVSLERLSLGWNQISDLSPLSGLTNLQVVGIEENPISEIPSEFINVRNSLYRILLTELVLEDLWFENEDIVPLRYMINLRHLDIRMDFCACWGDDCYPVCDIYDLQQRRISDISPLSGLTNLTNLYLRNHHIINISPLSGLSNLRRLDLGNNNITDISPLSNLENLESLFLDHNQISDISPLYELTNLEWLGLESNPITDWSQVAHVENVWGRRRDKNGKIEGGLP